MFKDFFAQTQQAKGHSLTHSPLYSEPFRRDRTTFVLISVFFCSFSFFVVVVVIFSPKTHSNSLTFFCDPVLSPHLPFLRDRYSEATFIKELEAKGVGRPSTYAAILGTLRTRAYVNMQGRSLTPSLTGFVVADLLREHFPDFTDTGFTAQVRLARRRLLEIGNRSEDYRIRRFSFVCCRGNQAFFVRLL